MSLPEPLEPVCVRLRSNHNSHHRGCNFCFSNEQRCFSNDETSRGLLGRRTPIRKWYVGSKGKRGRPLAPDPVTFAGAHGSRFRRTGTDEINNDKNKCKHIRLLLWNFFSFFKKGAYPDRYTKFCTLDEICYSSGRPCRLDVHTGIYGHR